MHPRGVTGQTTRLVNGQPLEIGFNVTYLLDVLGSVRSDDVEITLSDSNSSCLIRQPGTEQYRYVVMPMRL